MNVLFVCSRNQWRSPTAETIYKRHPIHNVKSAGTEPSARIKITAKLIDWADIIFVMEKRHKERITGRFTDVVNSKQIIVLDIADDYEYMDEELIDSIKASVSPYL
ncbi:low molecular weight protein tyrosine phosphatase family protein [Spirosoma linguale]|uniref:Protein-tyrosine phosphatase, low molecular weight n=1 Tax=Spirosoma linguale (strain ATCC 33905 / DSM 74 / LMG 10896 / Claus 1) TaxID=504472 RepID=D2QRP7_SPILD|nr:Protein-tyrosine phosphatase, low molecular weight [Spirosoma linguale DSM 74]